MVIKFFDVPFIELCGLKFCSFKRMNYLVKIFVVTVNKALKAKTKNVIFDKNIQ